ncbi:family 16 glycoside hydrolase [uncultured Paraglaciecola sp.]|uniref:family 16 glycoside hydrolase n=1 Tax=uncultured Paraglaciecola sp. TaxID=1765024 RepID=UPI0030D7533D|tara:strand:+ start:159329 stop:162970 length:3642 start_codon:yes stop_codon:yes gene_type:complete
MLKDTICWPLIRRIAVLLCCSCFFQACSPNSTKGKNLAESFVTGDVSDVKAMRSTLDGESRVISLKLGNDITAAYDTKHSVLFKLWHGNLDLTGAVFDQKHGPQPTAMGQAYVLSGQSKWSIEGGNVTYVGHQIYAGKVTLLYRAKGTTNAVQWQVDIKETPMASLSESGLVFSRQFNVSGLPANLDLTLDNLSPSNTQRTSGAAIYDERIKTLFLANGESTFSQEYNGIVEISSLQDGSQNELEHPGLVLINNSDCVGCHNAEVKTVGPSYQAIAQRYAFLSGAREMLSQKIIQGGTGRWGQIPMTPHSQLSESDAGLMLDYIFSLNQSDNTTADATDILLGLPAVPVALSNKTPEFKEGMSGVYVYQHNLVDNTADIEKTRKNAPSLGGLVSQIHLPSEDDFRPTNRNFMYQIKTHLNLKESVHTRLRLVSDDGSYLYLNGERIIDNWGAHGPIAIDAEVQLEPGLHSLEIFYYQGGGGASLSLQWLDPATQTYELIPAAMLQVQQQDLREVVAVSTDPNLVKSIAGDKMEVAGVHPSFDLSQARPDAFQPMVGGIDFLDDGRMVVSTWDPEGSVYLVENFHAAPDDIKVKRIALGLAEPLGVKVVDGEIYVLQKQELTRLVDTNGDDIIDRYELVSNDWSVTTNFHEFAFGLEYQDGYFYAAFATAILPGGASASPQASSRGKAVKISKDSGQVEFIAQGLRTPNSIGRGIGNQLFIADNQGDWVPACKIVELSQDAWYGSRSVDFEGTANLEETLPVVWLPQGDIGNSASQPAPLNVGPYQNQMIHGDVTHGGIKRVFAERVNGRLQGVVFRFSQGLEAGVNRLQWAPDGSLIVGGVGNPGNWSHSGKKWYGLQSLKYNQQKTFEMLSISAHSDGFEITFTEAIKEGRKIQASDFEIQQYYFEPTAEYGGPKKGLEDLNIQDISVSADRTKVQIKLAGLKEKHVVYFRINRAFESQNDHELWTTEAWYTLNAIPTDKPLILNKNYSVANNTLTENEKAAGWELLFDGNTLGHFRNYNSEAIGSRWRVEDGTLHFGGKAADETSWQAKEGGDIVITSKPLENYELNLEWKIQHGGNSGIIYNVKERADLEFPFLSGTEMQILDNPHHSDGQIVKHRAGDNYDLIESRVVSVLPAGYWNQVRLIVNKGRVEHWLNGYKVVDVKMYTPAWEALIAQSKFKDWEHFAKTPGGHIVLQDHGDKVWFRNLKLKEL